MFEASLAYARKLDENDPLAKYRDYFNIPKKNGKDLSYFCGNSLGLQPKTARKYFDEEFDKWAEMAVEGHFTGERQWVKYHHLGKSQLSEIVGAKTSEVVIMNNLTTNLHLMLASFYKPTKTRKKIIIEKGAFPSDHYAVSSFMEMLGVSVDENLVLIEIPEDGYLSNEVIIEKINELGEELCLVMLPGVQYYTGQFFDLKSITKVAHKVGAKAGFDLAHAAGNIPMNLHDDEVDFAVWCSYKYLNSGPGNVSGAFVHENNGRDKNFPKLKGWWGHNEKTRFKMDNIFDPNPGIDAWMLSNVNVLATAIHLASLDIFQEAGIQNLRKKSVKLTGYLEYLLKSSDSLAKTIRILTPSNPDERGCQLSLFFKEKGKECFEELSKHGYIMDWREPNVIRVAPTPLYNRFEEVFKFVEVLTSIIK